MGRKKITKRNKIIISISAITALLAVFLLCTIYDYQISEAIAQLTSGKYLSENKFGAFFEVIGEMPMYVIGVFSACNIIRKAWQVNSKKE
jgi:nitrogen fixation/metabolism regulation signal transduction histidine kinase